MVALFILFFKILLFYLERKTTSRRAGLSATAEFLVCRRWPLCATVSFDTVGLMTGQGI